MSRRIYLLLTVLCLVLVAPILASAQEPQTYTFVAEWAVPRAQWDEFTAFWEKNARPVLERLTADGTLVGWGVFAVRVHTVDGMTHGTWYWANSIAAGQRALDELIKLPPNPAQAGAKHRDYLLRSLVRKDRAASGNGYLWVSSVQVQPGKGQQWRELWEKYTKPVYDELQANGTISMYELVVEHVHTENPGTRFVAYVTPSADGLDKVQAALAAAGAKRSAEENRAIGAAFAEVTVAGAHRDFFARVSSYARK